MNTPIPTNATPRQPRVFTGWQALIFSMLGFAFLVGACSFMPNPMHTEASIYESPMFANATEARKHLKIPLPDEAVNIRFAGCREWIAADDVLRFEAPVDVCLKHAGVMFPGTPLTPIASKDLPQASPPLDELDLGLRRQLDLLAEA